MAICFECDYCGDRIYRDHEWVKLEAAERTPGTSAKALNRMGLEELDQRIKGSFHFHLRCFDRALRTIDNHRSWAQGDSDSSGGLEWELVEKDHWRRPVVLEPRRANRILALCRERNIDRDALAEALGTSRGAVGRWLKSYLTTTGRPMGITAKWMKRLTMYFDLDSMDELFERELTGDAPADEFEAVA